MAVQLQRRVSHHQERKTARLLRKIQRRVRVALRQPKNNRGQTPVAHPRGTDKRIQAILSSIDKIQLTAALARASFYDFVKIFWKTVVAEELQDNWHIEYICNEMQKCAERVFKGEEKAFDEVFNVPPGSSKSTICSIMFPAWVWTRMPSARFICCSYAEKLALTLSRKCRDVIKSELYKKCFPEIQFRPDQDTKGMFANTNGGERYAVGSSGFVMGNHAHFIIIDDPVDPEAVLSDTELERINNWIKEQLSGRKVNRLVTVTFLIMQRLHQSDPTAQMLKQKKVKHVKLPATTEYEVKPASLKKYYVDGLMDPIRLPRTALDEIRNGDRGEYVMAGQYGQEPVPPGGGMFKIKRIAKISQQLPLPKMKTLVRYWDKAASASGGAYTVGVLMGISAPPKDEHLFRAGVERDPYRPTPKMYTRKAEQLEAALKKKGYRLLPNDPNGTANTTKDRHLALERNNGLKNTGRVRTLLKPYPTPRSHQGELPEYMNGNPSGSSSPQTHQSAATDTSGNRSTISASGVPTRTLISGGRTRLFILDVVRVQLDSWQRERLIKQTAREDGKHVIIGIEQEGAGGGKESAENTTAMLMGYKVKVLRPTGRKELRAEPFSVQVNAGNVYVLDAPWTEEYLSELKHFPFSTYKDQVDASAGAFTCLMRGNRRVGGMRRGGG